MRYLIDTNVFLEILLTQEKRGICKKFLNENIGNLCISDFSLHSIGVILFRNGKEGIFRKFASDILSNIEVLTMPIESYKDLEETKNSFGLDFDDAYQYGIAKSYALEIVTFDKDFQSVKRDVKVLFL